jgi:DNA invertase Pin-like site-specific DNA recombinase
LVIWSLDRLTREGTYKTLGYIERLKSLGIRVRSIRESWMDTESPCAEVFIAVLAWAAKQERQRIVERTKAGLNRARAEGKKLGRPRGSKVRGLTVEAIHERIELGESQREIARSLGVSPSLITKMLKRE